MVRQTLINPIIPEVDHAKLINVFRQNEVVVKVLHIIVIADVFTDRSIPRLSNVLIRIRVLLLSCPAINRLLNRFPAHVMVGDLSFEERSCLRHCGQN